MKAISIFKKSRWCLIALLLAAMTGMLFIPVSAAGGTENMPGYIIDGEVSDGTFTARVYLSGANGTSGSIALRFDPTKLELADDSSLLKAVTPGTGVTISPKGLADEVTASQKDGRLLIAWYPSGLRLNALAEDQLVCSVTFNLKPTITESDLDASSLRLYDLREGQFTNWESGASIVADIEGMGTDYVAEIRKYNVSSSSTCYVKAVYPGSDRIPEDAREVTINVKDILEQEVPAKIMANGCLYETDSQGQLSLQLVDGTYSYQVFADTFNPYIATFDVDGSDTSVDVALTNDKLRAQLAANKLEITYAEGDSAESVTQSVKLPLSAGNRMYVFWSSDKPDVIANDGTLSSVTEATVVELTATVAGNGENAKRVFTLVVIPKDYDGEIPDVGGSLKPGGSTGGNTGGSTGGGDNKPATGDEDDKPVTGGETNTPVTGGDTAKKFTDLSEYSWAEDAINTLASAGIINGVSETAFNPAGNITRADFTCLLMRMLLPEGELADSQFYDVAPDAYYYNEVMRAKKLGIVAGSTDGNFNPQENITRQDMILITYRAMEAMGRITTQQSDDVLSSFSDGADTAQYARLGVAAAVDNGWIRGTDSNELQPTRNCTRAEAAVFIERIYIK